MADGAPDWFVRALATVPEHRSVEVAGARIHYRAWGPRDAPGVVLVHGGAAHAGWWDHIAPQLSGQRVVALDLSGHGDSDHREAYDMRLWAQEIVEVSAAEDLGRPVVVGHSRGGWVTATAGAMHGAEIAGVALIDTPLWTMTPDEELLRRRRAPRRIYPTLAEALDRFVTLPAQDLVLPYVRTHIAEQSLGPVEGGWTWKFDPRSFGNRIAQRPVLEQLAVPTAVLYCEHGLVSAAMAAEMAGMIPGRPPLIRLADAGHHPMLDRPLELVGTLRAQLAAWAGAGIRT